MSDAAHPPPVRPAPGRTAPSLRGWTIDARAWVFILLGGLALHGIFAVPAPSSINGDTAWLIHVIEQARMGTAPYRDILETNPPGSLLLYWPAVALGALTGLGAERAVYAFVCLAAALSVWLCVAIRHHNRGAGRPMTIAVLGVVLLLLPGATFSQREHLAVIGLAPLLLLQVERVRRDGLVPPAHLRLLAGFAAGLAVAIKPHFALAVLLPALVIAVRHRDARPLFAIEHLVAAGVSAALLVLGLLIFPAFLDTTWPLVKDGYLQARLPLMAMPLFASGQIVLGGVIALTIVAVADDGRSASPRLFLAATVGFAVAFIVQGKGFGYHALPVILVACLGLLLSDGRPAPRPLAIICAAAVAIAGALFFGPAPSHAGLRQDLERLTTGRDGLLIISPSTHVSFPLVREIGARWAGSTCCAWIASTPHAALHPAQAESDGRPDDSRFMRLREIEARRFAADLQRNRPGVVVFDTRIFDMQARLTAFGPFEAAMKPYQPAGQSADGRFRYFSRR